MIQIQNLDPENDQKLINSSFGQSTGQFSAKSADRFLI